MTTNTCAICDDPDIDYMCDICDCDLCGDCVVVASSEEYCEEYEYLCEGCHQRIVKELTT